MVFRDMELDFDIFNAEDADAYEEAAKIVQAQNVLKPGEKLGDVIRRQCRAIFDFFDALFGEGFHKELFGERTNLMECMGAFKEFVDAIADRKAEVDTMLQDIKPAATPNRAVRRAATKTE